MKRKSKLKIKARKPVAKKPWYAGIPTVLQSHFFSADSRGSLAVMAIAKKLKMPIGSVVVLESKDLAQRANHKHKADAHVTYIAKGWMEYFERAPITGTVVRWCFAAPEFIATLPVGSTERFEGPMFFTPPKVEHTMRFHGDCIAVVLANKHRDQAAYEKDIVKVDSLADEWDAKHAPQRQLDGLTSTPTGDSDANGDAVRESSPLDNISPAGAEFGAIPRVEEDDGAPLVERPEPR